MDDVSHGHGQGSAVPGVLPSRQVIFIIILSALLPGTVQRHGEAVL